MFTNLTKGHFIIFFLVILCAILTGILILNIKENRNLNILVSEKEKTADDIPTEPIEDPISPHKEHIDNIESKAGLNLTRLTKLIIKDEGKKQKPYLDSEGYVTIGVGRSLATNGLSITEIFALIPNPDFRIILTTAEVKNGRVYIKNLQAAKEIFQNPLSEHDIELLLTSDLNNTVEEAIGVFGSTWNSINEARKEAIIDTVFNLGITKFKEFKKFIGHVKMGEWKEAGIELHVKNEELAERYYRNAMVIQTGNDKYLKLEK